MDRAAQNNADRSIRSARTCADVNACSTDSFARVKSVSNRIELCFAALQRSGHHAIINWVLANSSRPYCFLNNCRPQTNPFLSCHSDESIFDGVTLKREARGDFSPKNLLIYNYEDCDLQRIFNREFAVNRSQWVGESERSINVLVLRDPFNNFASKYLWATEGRRWPPSAGWVLESLPKLWKSHALEFLGLTSQIPEPKLCVNYNRWVVDAEYRAQISEALALESSHKGLDEVAKWGPTVWGDSFNNLEFEGRAGEMKVLERWKFFAEDPTYRTMFEDPELIELSERIFGPIPGTSRLFRRPNAFSARRISYVEEAPGVISFEMYERVECESILAQLSKRDQWKAAQVREAQDETTYQVLTQPEVRSASTLYLSDAEQLYLQFGDRINSIVKPLIRELWEIELADHSDTHILKYLPGDHYVPHQDTGPTLMDRYFSLVCYLNDDFDGGQTAFPALHCTVRPVAGKAILFPSTYLHGSNPVVSGQKFVFISWINGPVPIKWI